MDPNKLPIYSVVYILLAHVHLSFNRIFGNKKTGWEVRTEMEK